jgi:hypothetical protein
LFRIARSLLTSTQPQVRAAKVFRGAQFSSAKVLCVAFVKFTMSRIAVDGAPPAVRYSIPKVDARGRLSWASGSGQARVSEVPVPEIFVSDIDGGKGTLALMQLSL